MGQVLSDGGPDVVVRDNVNADLHALVADEDGWACNQLANVLLTFVAEGASEISVVGGCFIWAAPSPEHP
jgi:hypothetical protein